MSVKSCLIVDDSRVVRKVIRRVVEELGFHCEEAEDGQKARQACENKMPEAIVLDWNMPVMNGMDFLKELRQMDNGTFPKVIFCTIENGADKIAMAMKAGANEYIMKPFDSDIIKSKFIWAGLMSDDDE